MTVDIAQAVVALKLHHRSPSRRFVYFRRRALRECYKNLLRCDSSNVVCTARMYSNAKKKSRNWIVMKYDIYKKKNLAAFFNYTGTEGTL